MDGITRISASVFFLHKSIQYRHRIHTLKYVGILFWIPWNILYSKVVPEVWYPGRLCSAGSDPPQDFVRRGIRPHRTLFCGVSGPVEQASATRCTQPLPLFCWVWNPTELSSMGSDTSQDFVLWVLILCRSLFCGVSDPTSKLGPHRARPKNFRACQSLLRALFQNTRMYKLHYSRHTQSMPKEPLA